MAGELKDGKEYEVNLQLEYLEDTVQTLLKVSEQMSTALAAVSIGPGPSKQKDKGVESSATAVGGRIQANRLNVRLVIDELEDMIDRLQVK